MVTRGFTGRQQAPDIAKRLPPGQSLTSDFPVLSAGPIPHIRTEDWSFTLKAGPKPVAVLLQRGQEQFRRFGSWGFGSSDLCGRMRGLRERGANHAKSAGEEGLGRHDP